MDVEALKNWAWILNFVVATVAVPLALYLRRLHLDQIHMANRLDEFETGLHNRPTTETVHREHDHDVHRLDLELARQNGEIQKLGVVIEERFDGVTKELRRVAAALDNQTNIFTDAVRSQQ